ncbi:hypothetical protein TNCV_4703401 [Trichonephila clavipes]|nr:hypothetical protein TNCV_4703401 [Trichonephila clavipes]
MARCFQWERNVVNLLDRGTVEHPLCQDRSRQDGQHAVLRHLVKRYGYDHHDSTHRTELTENGMVQVLYPICRWAHCCRCIVKGSRNNCYSAVNMCGSPNIIALSMRIFVLQTSSHSDTRS